jgi:hypothetical protein
VPASDEPIDPASADWLELREWVQLRRAEFGITNVELAGLLGVASTTLATVIAVRRAPSRAMQRRLTEWVNSEANPVLAPEVATDPAPFRPNGNGHTDGDSVSTRAG